MKVCSSANIRDMVIHSKTIVKSDSYSYKFVNFIIFHINEKMRIVLIYDTKITYKCKNNEINFSYNEKLKRFDF